jgi:hypothetical protein
MRGAATTTDTHSRTGTHDFRWLYTKDYSVSMGADRAAIQVWSPAGSRADDLRARGMLTRPMVCVAVLAGGPAGGRVRRDTGGRDVQAVPCGQRHGEHWQCGVPDVRVARCKPAECTARPDLADATLRVGVGGRDPDASRCGFNQKATGTGNQMCSNCGPTQYAFPGGMKAPTPVALGACALASDCAALTVPTASDCKPLPTCDISNYYITRNQCEPQCMRAACVRRAWSPADGVYGLVGVASGHAVAAVRSSVSGGRQRAHVRPELVQPGRVAVGAVLLRKGSVCVAKGRVPCALTRLAPAQVPS